MSVGDRRVGDFGFFGLARPRAVQIVGARNGAILTNAKYLFIGG